MEKVHADLADVLERIKNLSVLQRGGVLDDLNNWQAFVDQVGFQNLGQMLQVQKICPATSSKGILLEKAIRSKKNEIAQEFASRLYDEGLTVQDAISILDTAKNAILNSKFTL
ncbi:hypothetical protein KDJ56_07050 [Brevibacillus composti]|uniref:Uncharacterized protein n=1 Tax=Brevibacillus composti TaxID=2796470 RepID=A0A7T5EM94_9BACL|nr:hypothetical protein [Brevibacillus composti]QQE75190.1 hypothetical protein JD108_04465 [Brevibacillus composti]QQE75689.1 hypothetical protein JD108_07370 [Brevibacillus composti]QUO42715.1 hypothetical protein KDJ56_07050 [Brevibacillus composti]